ncbi:hypothetical protein ASZ90_009182 [hydrocarbon metagenome]|uniref:Uncharacterized protein n=1 Tax=hydrocarbon metagenome TaxID=938273 RepID=A0A0W8FK25_9ZZZZ
MGSIFMEGTGERETPSSREDNRREAVYGDAKNQAARALHVQMPA